MPRIDRIDRVMIENIKRNSNLKIVIPNEDLELMVRGDSQFAHDVALAYQSLVLRRNKNLPINNN